ncbi:hypothetical protein NC652_035730 [Populus alba x Populus x berolinensis]|nr:hypothetical protein NC652_035730 [Populus alba x Populus x berolinensis]
MGDKTVRKSNPITRFLILIVVRIPEKTFVVDDADIKYWRVAHVWRAPVSRIPIKQEVSAQRLWVWKIGKLGKQQQRQLASEIVIHRDMACVASKIKHPVDPQQRKSWLVKNGE